MNPKTSTQPASFYRPTWCEVDIDAIESNVKQLKEMIGASVQLFVCLKGDALGCGAEEVALACERSGANGLAFGSIDAAIACREATVSLPMLLYPSCLPESASILERYGLCPTISTLEDVDNWALHTSTGLDVFLKIDSGGLRAGAFPVDAATIAQKIVTTRKLNLLGVYGHSLASYHTDHAGVPTQGLQSQIDCFLHAVRCIEAAGVDIPVRMFSSSEIVLSHPEVDLNAVEPGRLIVGIEFPAVASRARSWRPALVGLKSRVVMKKSLDNCDSLELTPFFPVRPGMVIGLLPIGWSDGYPRQLPKNATVLIRGQRVPILGPVHSELLRIDLTDVPDATVGDEVILLGSSGSEKITLNDLVNQWEVDVPDIYAAITKTVPRVYLRNLRPGAVDMGYANLWNF